MGLFSAAYNQFSGFAKAHPTALLGTAAVGALVGQGLYRRRQNNQLRARIHNALANSPGYFNPHAMNIVGPNGTKKPIGVYLPPTGRYAR